MITFEELKKYALSFPEATMEPHFEKISFRIRKKIFATYDEKLHRAVVKLNEVDQDTYALIGGGSIYPVPGKWGRQGWTAMELDGVEEDLMRDIVSNSYESVARKR